MDLRQDHVADIVRRGRCGRGRRVFRRREQRLFGQLFGEICERHLKVMLSRQRIQSIHMRTFDSLSEREILALAVSLEEDDERIYADIADGLRENYPATAEMFEA